MAKNAEGQWHCPVTFKVFTNNSHVVAIRTTGNVFSYDAVNELNIKPKNYVDLLTNEPFTRADIITLQNPDNPTHMALRDISNFKHLETMRNENSASVSQGNDNSKRIRHHPMAEKILKAVDDHITSGKSVSSSSNSHLLTNRVVERDSDVADVAAILELHATSEDLLPGRVMSDQKMGSSLTSSYYDVHTANSMRIATAEEARLARWRKMKDVSVVHY